MLGQPLDFEPGERYAYSNFGYCLLGRVIEAVTGQDYEQYVQQHVLRAAGDSDHADRQDPERSAGRGTKSATTIRAKAGRCSPLIGTSPARTPTVPGTWKRWMRTGAGSLPRWIWLVLPSLSMIRIVARILSADSIGIMYAQPTGGLETQADGTPSPVYYSCGWSNRIVAPDKLQPLARRQLARHGLAAGPPSRRAQLGGAVQCQRRQQGISLVRAIDPLVHAAAKEVPSWPEYDLFDEF
jgi:N-acyl-D-amino-acid deacylase